MWFFLAVAMAGGVVIVGRLFWMIDDWGRDWTCNHAQLSISNADPGLRPIEISGDAERVETIIRDWVAKQATWKIVSDLSPPNDSAAMDLPHADAAASMRRLHLTHTTPAFHFVDDIHVEVTPIESAPGSSPRCRVDASSQSRVGKGDLGQNPRNLRKLRSGILANAPN